MQVFVKEKDNREGVATTFAFTECSDGSVECEYRSYSKNTNQQAIKLLLTNLFLPTGYPESVSSDYLQYQIWNVIQTFCNSLAELLASRAVLEGLGVGNASASATNAMLLTIAQNAFSRLTTIGSAYYLGTSLFPEAKTYRLLADVLNDSALIFDVVSPHLNKWMCLSFPCHFESGFRIAALCTSGSLRATCSVVAGGSKAALTLHFVRSSANGTGDIGDLNAKDGSKETVLVLFGLLCGTFLLPYVTTTRSTYLALFFLVLGHLGANYCAVRSLAFHTLNRQRATIAWARFRGDEFHVDGVTSLRPSQISLAERVFENPARLRYGKSGVIIGSCMMACSFKSVFGDSLYRPKNSRSRFILNVPIHQLLDIFSRERYILWCNHASGTAKPADIFIVLKEGHTPIDHLKAWAHGFEVATMCRRSGSTSSIRLISEAYTIVEDRFESFVGHMKSVGWRLDEGRLVIGVPPVVVVNKDDDLVVDLL